MRTKNQAGPVGLFVYTDMEIDNIPRELNLLNKATKKYYGILCCSILLLCGEKKH